MRTVDPTPDRRPLIYGICAVAILLVAAFLFWPQGEQETDLVLTPESVRAPIVAGQESAAAMSGSSTSGFGVDADAGADRQAEVEVVDPGQDLAAETHIDGAPTQASPARPASPAATSESSLPEPTRARPSRPSESSPNQPGSTGEWVLNVGTYSSQANADRHVQQLARLGVSAHVRATSANDGGALYRVRIGYFPTSKSAQSYGAWLERSQNIDGWASKR